MPAKAKRFIIGGVILSIAIGYLVYAGLGSSTSYYLTVSELAQQAGTINGRSVRVNGQVAAGPFDQDPKNLIFRFEIAEGDKRLPVIYKGIVPDALKEGSDVVVEGRFTSDGVLQARAILTKCPSRYAPEK